MAKSIVGKAFDLTLFMRIIRYVVPYKRTFWFTSLLTILLAGLAPLRPMIIQYTLDNSIIIPNAELLLNLTLLMLAILVVESFVQFYQTYLANWLGQTVIKDLRKDVFNQIASYRLKYFDNNAIGTLVTRTISDIETISEIFSQGILIIIGDILKLIVVIIVMFYTDWRLALLSLASLPVLIIATNIFKNYIKEAFQDVRTQVSRLNAFVQEHITGMNIVQIFNKEEKELKKFKEINELHKQAHLKTVLANSIFFPVVEILSAVSLALLVWIGTGGVLEGTVSIGNLVAFILYIYMLFRPIRQLADRFNVLQMGMVASERVFKVVDTKSFIEDRGIRKIKELMGKIEIKNLWFAYHENDWVLKNISLKVKPGEKVALVGATGAGKSSVISLLGRFYEFQKGEIAIDEIEIKEFELNELRRNIGIVLQDVFLFSDSILNNITLNNPNITEQEVEMAAKAVGAHDFIAKLPDSYQYNVMERGGVLSVGQRQLISFIRAYIYNPKILILDEATSSIDSESEELIQQATEKLTQGRTSIIIAHRLATIKKVDRIIVLDNGEIVEQGSHEELLAKEGYYKKLYEIQFVEEVA